MQFRRSALSLVGSQEYQYTVCDTGYPGYVPACITNRAYSITHSSTEGRVRAVSPTS